MAINKQKNRKLLGSLLILGFLIISFCFLVSGLGFSNIYYETNPLVIAPGETKNIQLTLSSITPAKAKVSITEGGEIATITDETGEYDVSNSAAVNIRVSIPDNAPEGTQYKVDLIARDVTPTAGGSVVFAGETGAAVYVLVQTPVITASETPQEEGIGTGWIILAVIAVIILIIVIYYIIKKRRNS